MNLPMLVSPEPWKVWDKTIVPEGKLPKIFSIVGVYLTHSKMPMSLRFRIFTSKEYEHFYVNFSSIDGYKKMCEFLNKLKDQWVQVKCKRPDAFHPVHS